MKHFVINLGRQWGSGGKLIAEQLSKALQINCYDRKLLDLAAQESGFDKHLFERNDEQKSLFESLFHMRFPYGEGHSSSNLYANVLSEESLFQIQSDTIRHLAERESCIFVGRCADYILRDHPRKVSLFIAADEADRIHNVCQRQNVTPEQARELIEKADRRRSKYYNYYTDKTWGAAASYDLCVNLSRLGTDATYGLLLDFVRKALKI